jgi:antitoxin CptB
MTGSTRSSEGLDERRRRLLFRSWHRGIRETDLLLGRFADSHIADLSDADLDEYERLLEVPDHDLYGWITGEGVTPPSYQTSLFGRLRDFHRTLDAGAG